MSRELMILCQRRPRSVKRVDGNGLQHRLKTSHPTNNTFGKIGQGRSRPQITRYPHSPYWRTKSITTKLIPTKTRMHPLTRTCILYILARSLNGVSSSLSLSTSASTATAQKRSSSQPSLNTCIPNSPRTHRKSS